MLGCFSGVRQRVRRLIQRPRRPFFDVTVIQPDAEFIAGERQDICTIEISLSDIDRSRNAVVEFPIPSYYLLKRNWLIDCDQENISDNILSQTREKMVIIVFANLTVSGNYLMHPEFPETSQLKFYGRNCAKFMVQPSRPESLTVLQMNPISGDRLNFYRGGKAEVRVDVKDGYCNIVEHADLGVESSHVTLESCCYDSESSCHVIVVDCNKEGRALLSLTCASLQADVECAIIPAPLCPPKCRVFLTKEKSRSVLAGEDVKWLLELRDIFNHRFHVQGDNAASLLSIVTVKIDDQLNLHDQKLRRKEENSFQFTTSVIGDHICCVQWKPLVAGNRSIVLSINGVEISKRHLYVNVDPGMLDKLMIEFTHPTCICYPTDEQAITVKGFDAYKNSVFPFNPKLWSLECFREGLQQRLTPSDDAGTELKCYYSFERPGRYVLQVNSPIDALRNIKVPKPFSVEVASPFDANKCVVQINEERPIFKNDLKVCICLSLCSGVSSRCLDHVLRFLEIKIDENSTVQLVCPPSSYKSWNVHLRNLQYGQGKTFEVLYCGTRLGEKLQVDLEGFCPFEITDYMEELKSKRIIRCKGVPIETLLGADKANIHNINRVLAIDDKVFLTVDKIKEVENQVDVVDLDLDGFDDESFSVVSSLIGLLVQGLRHYRMQAHRFGKKRRKWKEKEMQARQDEKDRCQRRNSDERDASECKAIKEKYGELMDVCHPKASDTILEFYNFKRSQGEIDLHGQQVANEQTLENLKKELLDRATECHGCRESRRIKEEERINQIIQSIRDKNDEAIRHLRHHMEKFDHEKAQLEDRDWLEIIVGAGHHSHNKCQKIGPKVEQFLQRKGYEYIESNPGSLLITFTKYSGEEPCVANFFCHKCLRSWESRTSWIGMFQKCYKCYRKGVQSKCFPFKLRSTSTSYKRRGGTDFNRRDHRKLCQKCIELGRDCSGK